MLLAFVRFSGVWEHLHVDETGTPVFFRKPRTNPGAVLGNAASHVIRDSDIERSARTCEEIDEKLFFQLRSLHRRPSIQSHEPNGAVKDPFVDKSVILPYTTPMLIGIDASRANKSVKTGVEWYSFHLIQALKELTKGDRHQWVLYTREPLKGALAALPQNWYEVRAGWWPKYLWTRVRMSWEMWRRPVEVFFDPSHTLPPVRPEKSVVTIHDVGFRRFPPFYPPHQVAIHEHGTRLIAKSLARIITISEFTARELVELYGIDSHRIAITPLGIDHALYKPLPRQDVEDRLAKLRVPSPYLLFVGRQDAKKNLVNLIKAFNVYKNERGVGDPTRLVLAGPAGYGGEDIKKAIAASPFKDHILTLGYVKEEDVPYLLNGAKALVHVAWYEGFGLPPVQAMACGCPVVAADNSCLPSVIGEGNALFVSPSSPDAIARALMRLDNEPALVEDLRRRGMDRAAMYTWEACAKATRPVLTEWLG